MKSSFFQRHLKENRAAPNRLPELVGLTVLVFNLLLIIYYVLFTAKGGFTSDEAWLNVLAQEIIGSKKLIPNDWWYVNGDFWLFSNYIFIIPFAYFGVNNYLIHCISIFLTLLCEAASVFYLFKTLKLTKTKSI